MIQPTMITSILLGKHFLGHPIVPLAFLTDILTRFFSVELE